MSLLLLESALRSLMLASVVWAGLQIFRVRNVVAQKTAWGLVLATALVMPWLAPVAARWQLLPPGATLVLPAHPMTLLEELQARLQAKSAANPRPASITAPVPQIRSTHIQVPAAPEPDTPAAKNPTRPSAAGRSDERSFHRAPIDSTPVLFTSVENTTPQPVSPQQVAPQPTPVLPAISLAVIALFLYLAVAAVLLARIGLGLLAALRLLHSATPVAIGNTPYFAAGLRLRSSSKVASPITIGSAVVLPADYEAWDTEKLRIVLAHEHSHIRQGDFYLQLLAGLYSALVWFSPLGWWIKSELSDLAEAISDRAGLEQAASRSSYAQILLEFAAAPRPTPIGVAMARTGSLSRRIERLLNDSAFRQAFSGGRARIFAAVLLVPAALFAATALVRVEAAGQTAPPPPPPAQVAPEAAPAPDLPAQPASDPQVAPAPQAAAAPQVAPAPQPGPPAALAPVAPEADIENIQILPAPPAIMTVRAPRVVIAPMPKIRVNVPMAVVAPMPPLAIRIAPHTMILSQDNVSTGNGYSYHYSNNGESYAVISGDGSEHMTFSGDIHTGEIDKARKLAHGAFVWFNHDGKSYYIDDPQTLANIKAMYAPMEALGKQQEELGKQQEELGKQQEVLGEKQEQAEIPAPDISKEMAELNASMAKLQAKMGKTVTREELADLQGELGELQGRLGELQGEMGSRQGEFGEKMGKLGELQGELGAKQGKLGAEQGRLAQEADRKIKSIIDESLHNGKAHPVE